MCICFLFSVFFFCHVLSLLLYICFLSIFFFPFSSHFLFLFWIFFLFILWFPLCLFICLVFLYFFVECCWFVFSIRVFCSNMFAHSDAFCSLSSSSSSYYPSSSSCLSFRLSLLWIAFLSWPACRDDCAGELPARTSKQRRIRSKKLPPNFCQGPGWGLNLCNPSSSLFLFVYLI